MKFSDEYKSAAQSFNPDKDAVARMKANVMKQIAAQENGTAAKTQFTEKPKNFLPLSKRAAIFGGSAAACAVIAVCAVKLAPIFTQADKLTNSETLSAGGFALEYDDAGVDLSAEIYAENELTSNNPDNGGKAAEDAVDDDIEEEAACDDAADNLSDSAAFKTEKPNNFAATPSSSVFNDETDGYYTAETEENATCEYTDEWVDEWEDDEYEEVEEVIAPNEGGVEALMFGDGYVSTVINISDDLRTVWVYGDGDHNSKGRYGFLSADTVGADDLPSATLLNETDGQQYLVKLEKGRPNCIYVFDGSGKLLGKYKKNA